MVVTLIRDYSKTGRKTDPKYYGHLNNWEWVLHLPHFTVDISISLPCWETRLYFKLDMSGKLVWKENMAPNILTDIRVPALQ